ncbi:MAG TPA: L,D-transpeptidase [Actinomycetota bacterium]
MRHHGLRASWIATILATVIAVGTPLVGGAGADPSANTPDRSIDLVRAERPSFTDLDPSLDPKVAGSAADASTDRSDERTTPRRDRAQAQRARAATTHLLVRVPRSMVVRARPDTDAAVVGSMPSGSKYYGVPITAWVEETANHGRWGRVEIPYVWPRHEGWIPLRGLARTTTRVQVHIDLSEHRLTVSKFGHTLFGLPAATGAPVSPTPRGDYFVTDRIPFSSGGSLGTFAFGISGIQPNLPPGWNGGNQLAIHGTNDPSSIGRSASAGCLRVSERGLDRLLPLLKLGTPVIVEA